ncbi:class I SAM-dependent methyltransferase [Aequorivita sp. H23M31]|uniref:Class I SAM-dependent methyltransferase n=1 Tax=Aequorivita ciconiae TaxID=2494375 RepID=A0A410G557_9FLAO|nr:class I SAM-dependent methyltransferase [Aequorivita sp. H23M31]QAA82393.1 class I SAM-dependent methyltransferase [Aequorivita sp. H23M31]
MLLNQKDHWETVYKTKDASQVSWTQSVPITSLEFIHSLNLPKNAAIIDVGGGDSNLVDYLLDAGFTDITVLDISSHALEKAKLRLGEKAKRINWVVSNITEFNPTKQYDLWHDRAAFHFLIESDEKDSYLKLIRDTVKNYLVIGTFSVNGPTKCSGLEITQYSENTLSKFLEPHFEKIKCKTEDHITPFNTSQNFLFCSFKRLK